MAGQWVSSSMASYNDARMRSNVGGSLMSRRTHGSRGEDLLALLAQLALRRTPWTPEDLTRLRDLVLADRIPQMTTFESEDGSSEVRLAYVLGHAVFDFIEATHGKAAVTQFLFELRRNVIDGTGDLYQAAFYQTPEEFDAAFERYLKVRFAGSPG